VPFDGAFSPLHWIIVAVVALLVLGPEQLPRLARRAGETMRDLGRVREHLRTELRDLVSEFDLEQTSSEDQPALPKPEESP
jgi:TatA/E family protein of Tat protein translocase